MAASMNRDEAIRLAKTALEREGCVVTREVGAVRFFSLMGMWSRWSMGFGVTDATTGEMNIGHASVTVSEISCRVVRLYIPPPRTRIYDPFWHPPEPLWKRLGLCFVVPLAVLALAVTAPFTIVFEFVRARMRWWMLPRCRFCKHKLRTPHIPVAAIINRVISKSVATAGRTSETGEVGGGATRGEPRAFVSEETS